ncbi:hypothetical protein GO755_06700 [Spirosoma sp. HMF4905]|uniref:Uncharacterized protein n=1 Tax=Spirosoma arboris TaxID=2682092 RepID=A0A7K1S7C2_9BACT|nr:hypothetical protein [Spirosoma arboris]MVM29714.1 hypothetical protein [Spirosoma arboris]
MIYIAILAAFGVGYFVHILQHTLQNKQYDRQAELIDQHYTNRLCQQAEQLTHSLQLNVELANEKLRLQRRLRELQDQHERTLAALN